MKTIILNLLLGLLLIPPSYGQLEIQAAAVVEGDYILAKSYPLSAQSGPVLVRLQRYTKQDYQLATGLNINLWLNEWLALNYEFHLAYDRTYGFRINTGWGQMIGGSLIDKVSTGVGATLVTICMFIPEGITFNFETGDKTALQFYFNPLEANFLYLDNKNIIAASEIGLKLQYEIGDGLFIRPKLGIRYQYLKKRLGLTMGLEFVFFSSQ